MEPIHLNQAQSDVLRKALEPNLTGQTVVGGLPLMLNRLKYARDRRTEVSYSLAESLSVPCQDSQFANIDAIALQTLDDLATEINQAFHSTKQAEKRLESLRSLTQKDPAYGAAIRQSLISLKPLAFMQEHLLQHSEDFQKIAKRVQETPRSTVREMTAAVKRDLYPNEQAIDVMTAQVTSHQIDRLTANDWPAEWTMDLFFEDLFSLGAFFSIIDVEDIRRLKPKSFCNIESLVLLSLCSQYVHLSPIGLMAAGLASGAFGPLQYQDDKGRVLEMALDKPEERHAPIH